MNTKIFFSSSDHSGHPFPQIAILFRQEELLVMKHSDDTVVFTTKAKEPIIWDVAEEFGIPISLPPTIEATLFEVSALLERVGGQLDFLKAGHDAANARARV